MPAKRYWPKQHSWLAVHKEGACQRMRGAAEGTEEREGSGGPLCAPQACRHACSNWWPVTHMPPFLFLLAPQYGDIWVFEKDVQTNGWDDEHGGHGHGHH